MDYCHPCQRHLNGALACAGCGTPADALAPYAVAGPSAVDPEPPGETLETSGAAGHRRRVRGAARPRRRRGHRRRGRALLLTAAGAVLALGALSLAELAMEPGGDSGGSEYVSEATTAATEPVPSASSSTEADDPGPVEAPTVVPVTDSHSATATTTGGPARTTAPGVPPSPSAPAKASPSASAGPEETEAPAEPSDSGKPTADPTPSEPSDEPTPTPSPTETCIWWIFCP
ncbi:hypothetical protein AB0P41_01670 [Streptomyces sp. NPDC079167]|uniref:SCO2400 family protein n=1 Tax=Streptomyces sp. NPDC079167 TaxID=3154513 RepID=UPI003420ABEF